MSSKPKGIDRSHLSAMLDHLHHRFRGSRGHCELALACALSRGHLLLEGPPGTGKTSLAKALSEVLCGSFRRVQMTSDLLPSDIVGILRLVPGSTEFEFRPGPIFANILMVDELNRSSPKTQSALLEAMAEGQVSVDGKSYGLPDPFFVISTQNPQESQGVYPLAESQLDRFALCLQVRLPDRDEELEVHEQSLRERASSREKAFEGDLEKTVAMLKAAKTIPVERTVLEYATEMVRATREDAELNQGASVRSGIQLIATAQALALIRGQNFVRPREIQDLAIPALAHRIQFRSGEADSQLRADRVRKITSKIPPPL